MAAGRIHNFAFFLLTFYFPNGINQFESIMQNKPNFQNAQMNANTVITKDYENKRLADAAKTNPIQTQYKANTKPISSKAKMNANAFSQKDYENETAFKPQKNKPNSNPIKPNFPQPYCLRKNQI